MNRFQLTILACWFGLLVFLTMLLLLAELAGPVVRGALVPVTANALEFVIGAVVGALTTLMANRKFSSEG